MMFKKHDVSQFVFFGFASSMGEMVTPF